MPAGQRALRSLLMESAWTLRSKEKWAADFYNRIFSQNGRPQKVIVALARKLAVILWRLWLEDRTYSSDYQAAKG